MGGERRVYIDVLAYKYLIDVAEYRTRGGEVSWNEQTRMKIGIIVNQIEVIANGFYEDHDTMTTRAGI